MDLGRALGGAAMILYLAGLLDLFWFHRKDPVFSWMWFVGAVLLSVLAIIVSLWA